MLVKVRNDGRRQSPNSAPHEHHVKSDDPTACLSAPLAEDEWAGKAPSSPVGRDMELVGRRGCSYLLHHLTSGESVVSGDDCGNRKWESVNYLMLVKCRRSGEVITVTHQLLLFDNGSVFLCLVCWLQVHRTSGQSWHADVLVCLTKPASTDRSRNSKQQKKKHVGQRSEKKETLVTRVVSQAQHRGLSARKQPIRDLFPTATASKTQRTASSTCLSSWCLFQSQNHRR